MWSNGSRALLTCRSGIKTNITNSMCYVYTSFGKDTQHTVATILTRKLADLSTTSRIPPITVYNNAVMFSDAPMANGLRRRRQCRGCLPGLEQGLRPSVSARTNLQNVSRGLLTNYVTVVSSFLERCQQQVLVNGSYSSWETVRSGIPQGTVLGPTLSHFCKPFAKVLVNRLCSLRRRHDDVFHRQGYPTGLYKYLVRHVCCVQPGTKLGYAFQRRKKVSTYQSEVMAVRTKTK